MQTFLILSPVFIFLVVMLAMGFIVQKNSQKDRDADFSKDYYIGGRSLGGFVFAMTVVATYVSVSSFVGGPGLAWQRGFGWVLLAMTQVLAIFPVMGIMGKKMAVIGRKIKAVTVVDVIRVRFQSNLLANIGAVLIVIFFCAMTVGQLIGGATIFAATVQSLFTQDGQAVGTLSLFGTPIGYDYIFGMLVCSVVVIAFTAVGGFKAVAFTDVVCAMIMLLGMGVIGYAVLSHGGGMAAVMSAVNQHPHLLSPTAGGMISIQLLISFWLLVGICTMGLPQSLVRNLGFKTTGALHRAMIYGSVVAGGMILGIHLLGVLSRGIIHELPGATTDSVFPHLIVNFLPPLVAGIAIIAPVAAAISTISSLLLTAASSIIKDVYQDYLERKGLRVDQQKLSKFSIMLTAIIGFICFLVALNPPTVIVWVNMFAFGGLQTSFFWVFVLGFFWKKANFAGAFLSMTGGVLIYWYFMWYRIPVFGFHQIVVGISAGLILFVIGSFLGKPSDEKVLKLFFPETYPEGTKIELPDSLIR